MGSAVFSSSGLSLAGLGLDHLGLVDFGWGQLRCAGERTRLGWNRLG